MTGKPDLALLPHLQVYQLGPNPDHHDPPPPLLPLQAAHPRAVRHCHLLGPHEPEQRPRRALPLARRQRVHAQPLVHAVGQQERRREQPEPLDRRRVGVEERAERRQGKRERFGGWRGEVGDGEAGEGEGVVIACGGDEEGRSRSCVEGAGEFQR